MLALAIAGDASAARYALLIGNDSYQAVPKLLNARSDAEAMGQAMRKAGYQTTIVKDRSLKQVKDDIRLFKTRIQEGDEVVVFYAGHGVQIGGTNYLLPIDVRSENEDQVTDDALALSKMLSDIGEQKPAFTLAIVDACRDNPFKGKGRSIGGRGLNGVGGATGQMVMYSASTGQQALDRLGEKDPDRNGLFTRVFIKEMEQVGVPVDQVLRKVREQVNTLARSVKHNQVPALYDEALGKFYFYPPTAASTASAAAGAATVSAPAVDASPAAMELALWNSVKDSRASDELQAYLNKYPNGQFSGLAQTRKLGIELELRQKNQLAMAAPAESASKQPILASRSLDKTFRDCPECAEMVVLPKGELARAFAISKTEVTQAQWRAIMGNNPSQFKDCDDCPVDMVSWNDARDFLRRLNGKTGKQYRLPTESEWEYACRAGSTSEYCGSDKIDEAAWFQVNSESRTRPVGSKQGNAFGLADMSGNVWEWVDDCWHPDDQGVPKDGSLWPGGDCSRHAVRGGSWVNAARDLRAAFRVDNDAGQRKSIIGFRIAHTVP